MVPFEATAEATKQHFQQSPTMHLLPEAFAENSGDHSPTITVS